MILQLLILVAAFNESVLAIYCLRRHRRVRVLALALLISATLQVLSLLFGERLLVAWHMPSSSDPVADVCEVLFQYAVQKAALTLLSIGLALWLASWLLFKRFRNAKVCA